MENTRNEKQQNKNPPFNLKLKHPFSNKPFLPPFLPIYTYSKSTPHSTFWQTRAAKIKNNIEDISYGSIEYLKKK